MKRDDFISLKVSTYKPMCSMRCLISLIKSPRAHVELSSLETFDLFSFLLSLTSQILS